MVFLGWENEQDAKDSLAAVHAMYGCPHLAENGYRMDLWDDITKPILGDVYGFFKPEIRLGREMGTLMAVLVPGFTEKPYIPEDF